MTWMRHCHSQGQPFLAYLATKADDFSARVIWAGEGVDLVKDLPSAAELIERIVAEAAAVLARGAGMVR